MDKELDYTSWMEELNWDEPEEIQEFRQVDTSRIAS